MYCDLADLNSAITQVRSIFSIISAHSTSFELTQSQVIPRSTLLLVLDARHQPLVLDQTHRTALLLNIQATAETDSSDFSLRDAGLKTRYWPHSCEADIFIQHNPKTGKFIYLGRYLLHEAPSKELTMVECRDLSHAVSSIGSQRSMAGSETKTPRRDGLYVGNCLDSPELKVTPNGRPCLRCWRVEHGKSDLYLSASLGGMSKCYVHCGVYERAQKR